MQQLKNSAGVGLLEECQGIRKRAEVPSASGVHRIHATGACWEPPCVYRALSKDGSKLC